MLMVTTFFALPVEELDLGSSPLAICDQPMDGGAQPP